ncbi:biotin-dependent carboxylase uncharacterized domain-containing protein [Pustulibacterium marinum]|uniref:Biotin-dependent carboxylase uncharacterized domain-containing protein n=1 Tax=Pustulibacterium marinum TaxID=1224947 RepID=A0A1I7IHU3_9FLAO|nr:biotin-dependent carboxyltransferase family protein [Pustulibacterium marinum]SFU72504.1 biotin-dependent carboxylase uncharacterized domain-containing protein [Pustulibacterium marinum]
MIKILKASFGLSIQDLGRTNHRTIGVPVSGVMDRYSMKLSNLILNNQETDAVLEITFGGCQLQFEEACQIAITGADFSPTLDGEPVSMNSALNVPKGAILKFGKRLFGVRTYVAVEQGFQTEKVLESRSMYKGITPFTTSEKETILHAKSNQTKERTSNSAIKVPEKHFTSTSITCFKGPEFDELNDLQKQQLLETKFTISANNSRMGYQLEELLPNDFPSMLTSAVLPGTVQLTPSGKLIVLMRDCQVTGGYPRVLQLTDTAINQLAQKTTGDKFSFDIQNNI